MRLISPSRNEHRMPDMVLVPFPLRSSDTPLSYGQYRTLGQDNYVSFYRDRSCNVLYIGISLTLFCPLPEIVRLPILELTRL